MKYSFDLIKSNRKSVSIEVRPDGKVTVHAPSSMSYKEICAIVEKREEWIERTLKKRRNTDFTAEPLTGEEIEELCLRLKEIIPEKAEYYAKKIGVTYGKITIRKQKTRWGSCSSKGNLSFNCLLLLAPERVMDSVIVHELCHLKEMNHSKRFYDEILKVMPDYYEQDLWLKKNGMALMQRLYDGKEG